MEWDDVMMDNGRSRAIKVFSLALALAWTAGGCGGEGSGGTDTNQADIGQPDQGMDIKPLDLTFDLVKPKDLPKDDPGTADLWDPGMELPPKAPMPENPGAVLITEFMARSQPGSDKGEWVELFNATAGTLDLDGCMLGDDASDDYLITETLRLEPGDFVVLARSDDLLENHGLTPDYVYNDFTLSNTEDEIILTCGPLEIDRVDFTADWVEEGIATQLSSTAFDAVKNDLLDWWCPATIGYGDTGKLGTPGEPNEECIQPDPCDPNPCTDAPAPECDVDGITLVTWQSPAPCTDLEGAPDCGDYPFTTTDCSLDGGQVCLEGACALPPPPQPGMLGDILITEFMAKSQAGSDPGEWVEVFNPGLDTLDLGGCVLGDGDGDAHTISGPLYLDGGVHAILAKGDAGFTADYIYTGFQLVNAGDAIVLTCGAVEIDAVVFSDAWVVEGVASQLSSTALDAVSNDEPAHWCEATAAYGDDGKLGTPGTANGECPDLCDPNPCTDYPPAECDPDGFVLHSWTTAAPCTLTFGQTACGEYPMDSMDCALEDKVCLEGACVDPCTPNPCTDYPAPVCDGDGVTLQTWDTPAPCTAGAGQVSCGDYPVDTFDCSTEDKVCVDGACEDDPCLPNPCTMPPAATCDADGITLTTPTSPAPCSNNGLDPVCAEYPTVSVDCSIDSKICVDGACVANPCEPNPCTAFPAAQCDGDGHTLLTYTSPAPCTLDGLSPVCGEYEAVSLDCALETKVCVDGACVPDPCEPNPCTMPPAPTCDMDGVTLITSTSPAPCTNEGLNPVCGTYPSISVNCSLSGKVCADGACVVFDPCVPNPCTTPPEPACDPDGITLRTWTSPGACTNENDLPVCGDYPSDTFNCSTNGMVCLEGACEVPPPSQPVAKGEVLVTEFMAMSQGGLGDAGEWVELYNATEVILNLDGCVLGDADADAHTVAGPLLVAPGGSLALARSDDPVENHGLTADYIYAGFQLSNTEDEIVLTCGATEIDRVEFTDAWVTEGVAIQLDVDAYDPDLNDDVNNWCAAKAEYGTAAKLGTPGELNGDCPAAPSTAGDLVFIEMMVRSKTDTDLGEWVELYNASGGLLELEGCILRDDDGDTHTIAGSVLVAAGGTVILGKSDDFFTADYIYTDFHLANGPDEVVLECGGTEIDRVNYDDAWYALATSTQLDPGYYDALSNDFLANWCPGTTDYCPCGKKGTPGTANLECPAKAMGWCRLQWPLDPPDASVAAGAELTVFGRVFLDGITNRTSGSDAHTDLVGQVGYGPDGSDPDGNGDWTWMATAVNPAWDDTAEPGNDEYMGALTVSQAGTWDHAYRFSADGGATWTYCDRRIDDGSDGSNDGYQAANAGNLEVTAL